MCACVRVCVWVAGWLGGKYVIKYTVAAMYAIVAVAVGSCVGVGMGVHVAVCIIESIQTDRLGPYIDQSIKTELGRCVSSLLASLHHVVASSHRTCLLAFSRRRQAGTRGQQPSVHPFASHL